MPPHGYNPRLDTGFRAAYVHPLPEEDEEHCAARFRWSRRPKRSPAHVRRFGLVLRSLVQVLQRPGRRSAVLLSPGCGCELMVPLVLYSQPVRAVRAKDSDDPLVRSRGGQNLRNLVVPAISRSDFESAGGRHRQKRSYGAASGDRGSREARLPARKMARGGWARGVRGRWSPPSCPG